MRISKFSMDQSRLSPGREGLITLGRKPFVQGLLALAIVGQVAAVRAGSLSAEANGTATSRVAVADMRAEKVATTANAATTVEAVSTAAADEALQAAWLEKATEREAERLGAEYRAKGYSVTPQLARQIGEAAAEFAIDPEVAFGLVKAESSFRNAATSSVGAVGLTQLMPRTASWIEPGVTRGQLRDPETNLRVGFKYLRYLMDKYEGNENLALLAYNRGPGTVDKALKRGRNPDNGYADFVRGKANHGHKLFTR